MLKVKVLILAAPNWSLYPLFVSPPAAEDWEARELEKILQVFLNYIYFGLTSAGSDIPAVE